MNFLELCKEARNRIGITRYGLPSTVIGQVGQLAYLVNDVARADLFIQRMHTDWNFLFVEYEWEPAPIYWTNEAGEYVTNELGEKMYTMPPDGLPTSEAVVSPPSTAWRWDLESFYINKGTDDATNLSYLPYREFRSKYYSEIDSNDVPSVFSIKPNGNIIVNPPPKSGQVLSADYFKTPVKMTEDTSESSIPANFHTAIIELAIFYHAEKQHDQMLMQTAWSMFQNELKFLEDNQLPERYETNSQPPEITTRVE